VCVRVCVCVCVCVNVYMCMCTFTYMCKYKSTCGQCFYFGMCIALEVFLWASRLQKDS